MRHRRATTFTDVLVAMVVRGAVAAAAGVLVAAFAGWTYGLLGAGAAAFGHSLLRGRGRHG